MVSQFTIPELHIPAFGKHVTQLRESLSLVTVSANMNRHLKRSYFQTDDAFCAAARWVRLAWRCYQLRPGPNKQGVIVIGWSLQSLLSRTGDPKTWQLLKDKIWKRYAISEDDNEKSSYGPLMRAIFQNKDRGPEVGIWNVGHLSVAEDALVMDPVEVKNRHPKWPERIQTIILDPRSGANVIFAIFAATRMGVRGGRLLADPTFGEEFVIQAAEHLNGSLDDCTEDRVRSIHYLSALAWILIYHCTGYSKGMPVKKIRMLVQRVVAASLVEEAAGKLTDRLTAETVIAQKGSVLLTTFHVDAMNHTLLACAGIMCYIAFVNIGSPSPDSVILELDNSGFEFKYLLPLPPSEEEDYNPEFIDLENDEWGDIAASDLKNLRVNPDCRIEDEVPARAELPELVVERKQKGADEMQDDGGGGGVPPTMSVPPLAEAEPKLSGKDEKMYEGKRSGIKRGADELANTGSTSKRPKIDVSAYQFRQASDSKSSSSSMFADMPRLEQMDTSNSSSSNKSAGPDLQALFPPNVDLPPTTGFLDTTKRLIQLGYSNRADIAKAVAETKDDLNKAAAWLRTDSLVETRAIGYIDTSGKNMREIDKQGYKLFAPSAILKLLEREAHVEDNAQRLKNVLAILAKVKSQQTKDGAAMVVPPLAEEMDLDNNNGPPAISTVCAEQNRKESETKVDEKDLIHIDLPYPLEVRLKAASVEAMQEKIAAFESVTIYQDNNPEASDGKTTVQYTKWSERTAMFATLFAVHREQHDDLTLIRFDKQLTEKSAESRFMMAFECLVHKLVLRALGSQPSIQESDFVQWLARAAKSKLNVASNLATENPLHYCIECNEWEGELEHLRPVLKVHKGKDDSKGVQCSWHDSNGVIGLWILLGVFGGKEPEGAKINLTQDKLTKSSSMRSYTMHKRLGPAFDGPFYPDYTKVLNQFAGN